MIITGKEAVLGQQFTLQQWQGLDSSETKALSCSPGPTGPILSWDEGSAPAEECAAAYEEFCSFFESPIWCR